jgi:hypothetical protein
MASPLIPEKVARDGSRTVSGRESAGREIILGMPARRAIFVAALIGAVLLIVILSRVTRSQGHRNFIKRFRRNDRLPRMLLLTSVNGETVCPE